MIHIIGITAMSRLFTDTDLTDMLQAIERLIKVLWDLNLIYSRVCVHNGLILLFGIVKHGLVDTDSIRFTDGWCYNTLTFCRKWSCVKILFPPRRTNLWCCVAGKSPVFTFLDCFEWSVCST